MVSISYTLQLLLSTVTAKKIAEFIAPADDRRDINKKFPGRNLRK